jgi:hypothetical protein
MLLVTSLHLLVRESELSISRDAYSSQQAASSSNFVVFCFFVVCPLLLF